MKRTLSILIVAVMLFGLLPAGAIPSSAATSYDLWVGETEVTSECTSGSGWSYEPTTNTLTLNGFTYSGAGHMFEDETRYYHKGNYNAVIAYLGSEAFSFVIEGENSVSLTGSNLDCAAGIYSLSGVSISGVGSLDVTVGDSLEYCHGIYVDGALTVSGSTLRFVCGHGGKMSRAVDAYGNLAIKSGEVYAEGGEADDYTSYGIFAKGKLEISGGKVTALGGKATDYSAGFIIEDEFFINGGTVYAAGGDAELSCGVMSNTSQYKTLTVDTGVEYFSSSGNSSAFESLITVKNLVAGRGWDNAEGNGNAVIIPANTEGDQPNSNIKKIVFPEVEFYDLFVGEVQVTSENCKDIPGVTGSGAKAEYDPDTATLTLTNVKGVTGVHGDAAIYAENIDLTVTGSASIYSGAAYGIRVCDAGDGSCSLTLSGSLTFNSLNCGVSCDGDIVIPDTHYIKSPFGGSVVTEPKRGTTTSYIADKNGDAVPKVEIAEKIYYGINVISGDGGTVSAPESALAGEPITVTIEPDEEYVVSKVTVSYGMFESIVYNRNTGDGSLPVKFTMPDANVTVTVTFSAKVYYGLSSLTVSEGTLDPEFKTKNASYTVDVGCGVDEVEVSFSCTSNRQLLLDESQFKPGSLTYQYNDPYYAQCKTDGVGTVVLTGEETTVKIKVNVINGPFDMVEYTVKITRTAHTLGHTDGVAAKCEETGMSEYWKCSVCGKLFSDKDAKDEISEPVVIGALGHDMGDWETVTEATCTEQGTKIKRCSRCTYTEDGTIDAPGHSFTAENTDAKYLMTDATCDGSAVYYKSCIRCGISSNDDGLVFSSGDPAGHDLGDWETVTGPTCTEKGAKVKRCSRCSYVENGVIDELGHDFTAEKVADEYLKDAATCTEPAVYYKSCTRCGLKDDTATFASGDPAGHDYVPTVTEPTCTEGGFTTYTCTVCGDSYTDDATDALGHDFTAETVSEEYLVSDATCTDPAVYKKSCTRCGLAGEDETFTSGDPLGHDYKEKVTDPTCTEAGFTTYTCTVCGDSYVDGTKAVGALGHEWDDGKPKAPTFDEEGEVVYTCRLCGETRTEIIPKIERQTVKPAGQTTPAPTPAPASAPSNTGAKQTGEDVTTVVFIAALTLISGAALVIWKKKIFGR